MQQHNSNVLIQEEEQRLNRSERKEIVLRYRFASPPYYQDGWVNEEFEQRAQDFEHPICYVVKQKAVTQGIIMSKGIEPILITRQELVVLLRAEPIIVEGVPMAVKVRYN